MYLYKYWEFENQNIEKILESSEHFKTEGSRGGASPRQVLQGSSSPRVSVEGRTIKIGKKESSAIWKKERTLHFGMRCPFSILSFIFFMYLAYFMAYHTFTITST